MSEELKQYLISEADRILSSLKLAIPSDRMVHRNPDELARSFIEKGLLAEAVEAYQDLATQSPNEGYHLYYNLLRHVSAQAAALEQVKAPPRPAAGANAILISLPVWGPKYIRTMLAVLLPTLMSAKNLPALSKRYEIIVEFSMRASEAVMLENSFWYCRLQGLENVTPTIARYPDELFESHPNQPEYVYRIMGAMHHLAVQRARAMGGMHVMPLCSDYIMSDAVLSTTISYLEGDFELVLMPSVKIRSDQALAKVLSELNGTDSAPEISIDAPTMSQLGIDFMHPECRQLIVSVHTKPFSKLPFPLLFPSQDGFYMRSFVYHPVAVSAELISQNILYDYNTVDGMFLHKILGGRDPADSVKLMSDSNDGIMLDLADFATLKEGNVVPQFEIGNVISWLFQWRQKGVEDIFKWIFDQRGHLRSGNSQKLINSNDLDEDTVVTVLKHVVAKFG